MNIIEIRSFVKPNGYPITYIYIKKAHQEKKYFEINKS